MAKILLSKENLFHNFTVISNQAGSVDKVAVVLKDNAYGHGLLEIATLAREFGIKKAVVKSLEEALIIEKLFERYSHLFTYFSHRRKQFRSYKKLA